MDIGSQVTLVDSLIPEYGGNWFNIHDYEKKMRVNICDIRDRYAIEHLIQGQDYLFNLAGQTSHADSMTQPEVDLAINCTAQLSILESCRKFNPSIRVVFASTRQIYGRPKYLPVDEGHPLVPVDVNGINKQAGESYHRLYSDVYGIPTTCLRLTNTFGPRMRVKDARQTFLGVWIRNAIAGMPIDVFGSGEQKRDFNFVEDCVQGLLLAGVSDDLIGGIYNLGGHEVLTLKEVAEHFCDLVPKSSYRVVQFPAERKVIDIGDYYGSYERFKAATGWSPKTSLRDGLEASIAFYKKYGEFYGIPVGPTSNE